MDKAFLDKLAKEMEQSEILDKSLLISYGRVYLTDPEKGGVMITDVAVSVAQQFVDHISQNPNSLEESLSYLLRSLYNEHASTLWPALITKHCSAVISLKPNDGCSIDTEFCNILSSIYRLKLTAKFMTDPRNQKCITDFPIS